MIIFINISILTHKKRLRYALEKGSKKTQKPSLKFWVKYANVVIVPKFFSSWNIRMQRGEY